MRVPWRKPETGVVPAYFENGENAPSIRELLTGAAAALVIAVGCASWVLWLGKHATNAVLHVTPVTSYRGSETTPGFSPDGGQIAFSWDGEKGDNLDIYVKVIGENRAVRLTSDPRPEFSPAWSPDERHIAFFRDGQDSSEIVLISPLGGPERVIAKLQKRGEPEHPGDPIAWALPGLRTVAGSYSPPDEACGVWPQKTEFSNRSRCPATILSF